MQARNFAIENQFSSEGFLATCHWHASPYFRPETSLRFQIYQAKTPVFQLRYLLGELDDVKVKLLITSLEHLDRKLESLGIVENNDGMTYLTSKEVPHV